MHGGLCERRHQRLHMWPVPAPTTVAADSDSVSLDCLTKDGRKIRVGDCALFKPPRDSPSFIGIIRKLTVSKAEELKVGVNWLYRPADVKLGKGSLLEAAPNEIFYSFHKDEIPVASVLHPCKVAFLRKGVELPSGISSFVCRRVYDIENKRLWWLTDQDYINERQEEVDKLLDKTRQEMHGATQPGGCSPKSLNTPTSTPQPTVQNLTSPVHSQVKGKKREHSDQSYDLVRREYLYKMDHGESGQVRPENMLMSEIAKITEKGRLVNLEGVEKLVQLMQSDSAEKKIDLAGRIMLLDVIAITDRSDCLGRFVRLRGLPVLDEWLQEVHKGKIGDASSKEIDKSVEDFLLVLLRALDKLPVNLDALQTCNVGKSVNYLRFNRNSEIQKKARSLVEIWKKRVEAEMNIIDAKSGTNRSVSWHSRPVPSEVCHVGSRRTGGTSEVGAKVSVMQPFASKAAPVRAVSGEAVGVKSSPVASPCSAKSSASLNTSVASNQKDSYSTVNVASGTLDQPLETIKEEKSSNSSQSQNNSQSCSSDHARTMGCSCREDARSSTSVCGSMNKISLGASRHRRSSNGISSSAASAVQKESGIGKFSSTSRKLASEKVSPTGLSDMPVDLGNNQRLIVRLPNTGRSPAQSVSGGSFEDPAVSVCRSSPRAHTEWNDNHDRKLKGKGDALRADLASSVNVELGQGKNELAGSDESNGPATVEHKVGEDCEKSAEVLNIAVSSSGTMPKLGKLYDASFSSINALVESCVKFSEASASVSAGDELGMNLLATVAAGEISKLDIVSPFGSPQKNSPLPDSCSGSDAKPKQLDENIAQSQGQLVDGLTTDDGCTFDSSRVNMPTSDILSEDSKVNLCGCKERIGEHRSLVNSSGIDLQQNTDGPCLTSDEKSKGDTRQHSLEDDGNNCLHEQKIASAGMGGIASVIDSKLKVRSPLGSEDGKADFVDEKYLTEVEAVESEEARTSAKSGKEANDDSISCYSSEDKDKKSMHNESTSCILFDPKPPLVLQVNSDLERKNGAAPLISHGNFEGDESRAEKAAEMNSGNSKLNVDMDACNSAQNNRCPEEQLEKNKVPGHSLGALIPHESSAILQQGTEDCIPKNEAGSMEEHASSVSAPCAAGSDMAVKLDFDLNEGFPVDDGNQVELNSPLSGNQSAVHLRYPSPFPMSSMSGSLATLTFAAAAKGPFLTPENLLRSKGALGWKGSAATSAFRPAEPRKILDMSLSESNSSKSGRPHLDFDLNVADERVLEDELPQNPTLLTSSESRPCNCSGGLDLDLNRADDDTPHMGQFIASNGCRPEIPFLPGRSSMSSEVSNGSVNISTLSKGFDLNNGPGPDEMGAEIARRGHHFKSNVPFPSSVPGVRMNSSEVGNYSSWFLPGNSYSAATIPSILPGVEQNYPPAGSHRVLGPHTVSSSFNPEIYRGPILSSSSPTVGIPPPTPFQYPGFPFETSFSLSSNSFSASSAGYSDSSSAGALCFPAIPSQLVGPSGVVSAHYPGPYVVNLPGATSNIGPESRKWGSSIVDLNAGPGTTEIDRRDERVLLALRQLPVASSQAMIDEHLKMYQASGGLLKRKEPDGGWDADRGGYKQPPWK